MSGESKRRVAAVGEVERHFRRTWEMKDCKTNINQEKVHNPVPTNPFTEEEVRKKLAKFENTASGNDGVTYNL